MQALKALVVLMGILIVAGMGLLVYGLMTRIGGDTEGDQAAAAARPFGAVDSALPAGAEVTGVSVEDGQAVVTVRLSGGGAEVRIFDLATGGERGVIRLRAAP